MEVVVCLGLILINIIWWNRDYKISCGHNRIKVCHVIQWKVTSYVRLQAKDLLSGATSSTAKMTSTSLHNMCVIAFKVVVTKKMKKSVTIAILNQTSKIVII